MRPAYYQHKWRQVKLAPNAEAVDSLAQRVASTFVDRYFYSDEYNADYIQLLCEMATHFEEESLNQIAARALFGIVIERLCDDFEELQTETYNRLICQVVDYLRGLPQGSELNQALNDFHLETEEQLYQRIESIRLSPDERLPSRLKPDRIIVLSRVTIGADVAVTSVICQRIALAFPDAEIVVAGSAKLREVFAENSGIRIRDLHYSRRGGLLERFLAWLNLLREIRAELVALSDSQYLVLDPDSRLTQLGVLPLVPGQNYRFFNSRGKPGYAIKASISQLTNKWLDNILGTSAFCYPSVWPDPISMLNANDGCSRLKHGSDQTLVALNFGVGGNLRKRVEGDFETLLVMALLSDPQVRVILDLGFGSEERQRSEDILQAVSASGYSVQALRFADLAQLKSTTRLLGVECSVAEIAALIAGSDEFIGYDSACQHIAAAQGIRTFTIFAGTSNARFIRRWQATGPNLSEILYVDTLSRESQLDYREIVARLLDLRRDQDDDIEAEFPV
ncbi:MAG: glycosyltransferase family 9 protein [Gammaproteobacteria bacterium]|nr:glycosyltransferase family 9 protein [Pseudomonadales bacterium]